MEFDQEAHDKILIMAKDITFIREQLSEGKGTFKEHSKRIRCLEQNQRLLAGKITILIMGIGAATLFLANFIKELIFK